MIEPNNFELDVLKTYAIEWSISPYNILHVVDTAKHFKDRKRLITSNLWAYVTDSKLVNTVYVIINTYFNSSNKICVANKGIYHYTTIQAAYKNYLKYGFEYVKITYMDGLIIIINEYDTFLKFNDRLKLMESIA